MNNCWNVYKHTSPSGKVYIGITKDVRHRWRNGGAGYKGSTRIANAVKKYGWDAFEHEVLFSGLSREEACKKEIELIKQYDSTNAEKGYNLLSGGECGLHSAESKERIRTANMGHAVTESTREKLARSKSIPVICLETKEIYRSSKEASEITGISRSSIGKACCGKAQTAGGLHFAKLSDYQNGMVPQFVPSPGSKKQILCVTTGERFDSEVEAAKKYGVTSQAISHACTGKVQTCLGMIWRLEAANA